MEEMNRIVAVAKSRDVVIGTFTDSARMMEMWMKAGVQYISYSVDVGIFHDACKSLTEKFHVLEGSLS